jgi:DNA-binding FadR family transcriptional regulator
MASSPVKVSKPAYSDELADLIISRYRGTEDSPAGKLPTERALAHHLGVTRTMVRNALAVLEARGRITREVGRGTFLRGDASRAGASAAERDSLVVAWATQRDFDEMRRCLDGGGTAENASAFEVWDFALHHAIVAASRNQLLLSMYAVVERARQGEIWGSLKRRNDSRERRATYQADHVELVEALRARELTRAVEVMDAHLSRVEANLLGGGKRNEDAAQS